jgi:uncharacterized membrane protein
MNTLTVVLRLVHVFGGVFWAGTTFLFYFVIAPAINATGDTGKKFVAYLITKGHFTQIISAAAGLTVLAGLSLYWIDSQGLTSAWQTSGAGVGFGIGGIFGVIAFVTGILFGRNNGKLVAIGSQIQGPPTPEQVGALQAVQKQQKVIGPILVISMAFAVAFMSAARYLRL